LRSTSRHWGEPPTLKTVVFKPILGVVLGQVLWFVAGLAILATGSKANDVFGCALVGASGLVQVLDPLLPVRKYQLSRENWPGPYAA
jgi:hypothetical protein